MNDEELDAAVADAKVKAGLDPAQKYPPLNYVDHMSPEVREAFWHRQVDTVLTSLLEEAERKAREHD